MYITKIEVNNFKSIKNYEVLTKKFNVFVGKNNHGKTNLFDAIDWFDSGKTIDDNYRNHNKDNKIVVRVYFSGAKVSLGSMPEGAYKTKMENVIGDFDDFIVEKTSDNDKRSIIVNGENFGSPQGFDSALNFFLPKVVYITTKDRSSDFTGFKARSPIGDMLSDVLKDMVDNEPRYRKFLEEFDLLFNTSDSIFRTFVNELEKKVTYYLSKQFAEGAEVSFNIESPAIEDMLKKFDTEVDDGIKTKVEGKGDGMQRAVILAIVQAYADHRKEKGVARNFIFLIDEAELHLHPTAQRSLKNALKEISNSGGQVFINSHSSIFANEKDDDSMIFKVEKSNQESGLSEVTTEQEMMDSIYDLLGGSPNDILLPSNFIIVEGHSDLKFLNKIRERFYANNDKCKQIKILFACGDHDRASVVYDRIHDAYTPLATNGVYADKIIFLLDFPDKKKEPGFQKFKNAYPNLQEKIQLHILTETAIEMYYPNRFKKTEDQTKVMTSAEKMALAEEVGMNITLDELNREMPIIVEMFDMAINKAYE